MVRKHTPHGLGSVRNNTMSISSNLEKFNGSDTYNARTRSRPDQDVVHFIKSRRLQSFRHIQLTDSVVVRTTRCCLFDQISKIQMVRKHTTHGLGSRPDQADVSFIKFRRVQWFAHIQRTNAGVARTKTSGRTDDSRIPKEILLNLKVCNIRRGGRTNMRSTMSRIISKKLDGVIKPRTAHCGAQLR